MNKENKRNVLEFKTKEQLDILNKVKILKEILNILCKDDKEYDSIFIDRKGFYSFQNTKSNPVFYIPILNNKLMMCASKYESSLPTKGQYATFKLYKKQENLLIYLED